MILNTSTLSNGTRVISEQNPNTQALYIGFWFVTGTRDEPGDQAGISHFLEHMVFKGTKKRSVYDISLALESVGGEINAFTSKEYTCFHTSSLASELSLCCDVLSDVCFSATLPAGEFEREQSVVLQEIAMSKEDYGEYIFDQYLKAAFPKSAVGNPILGFEETVQDLTPAKLRTYLRERYTAEKLIVTASGNVDHDELVAVLEKVLPRRSQSSRKNSIRRKPKMKPIRFFAKSPSEQVHILMGFPTAGFKNPDRFESYFVSTLLGGGMTSKLYQSVREKKGLAYSVYSYLYTFVDFAVGFFYAATDEKNAEKAIKAIRAEYARLIDRGITKKDLQLYKTQMRGNILLSVDDMENRMTTLAHNEIVFGNQVATKEIIDKIDAVSVESVESYIDKYMDLEQLGLAVVSDTEKQFGDF